MNLLLIPLLFFAQAGPEDATFRDRSILTKVVYTIRENELNRAWRRQCEVSVSLITMYEESENEFLLKRAKKVRKRWEKERKEHLVKLATLKKEYGMPNEAKDR